MAGNLNNKNDKVICCFCGKSLLLEDAAVLSVRINIESDEIQCLFCHKKCFAKKLHKSIIIHPDFFDIKNETQKP